MRGKKRLFLTTSEQADRQTDRQRDARVSQVGSFEEGVLRKLENEIISRVIKAEIKSLLIVEIKRKLPGKMSGKKREKERERKLYRCKVIDSLRVISVN